MGSLFTATCEHCGYEWPCQMGGTTSSYQVVCDTCGNVASRPRGARAGIRPPMGTAALRAYVADEGEPWPIESRPFTPAEQAIVARYFSYCGCGGRYCPEGDARVKHRCPECNSTQFKEGGPVAEID